MTQENRSRIQIIEHPGTKLWSPNVIVGVPEVGLVSTISASYLIQQLQLPEIGVIESEHLPQVVVVHEGEPKEPVRIYGKDSLAVIISETPLTPRLSGILAAEIVQWAKSVGSKLMIGFTGIPSRNRVKVESEDKPKVFSVTLDERLRDRLKEVGTEPFQEGVLVGTFASLLRQCMLNKMANVTFLAEAFMDFPDPGAAAAVVEVLNRFLSLGVDLKPLLQESEEIRLRSRELMNSTQQAMQQSPPTMPGVYK